MQNPDRSAQFQQRAHEILRELLTRAPRPPAAALPRWDAFPGKAGLPPAAARELKRPF